MNLILKKFLIILFFNFFLEIEWSKNQKSMKTDYAEMMISKYNFLRTKPAAMATPINLAYSAAVLPVSFTICATRNATNGGNRKSSIFINR